MTKPHVALESWLRRMDISQNQFAKSIEVHRSTITLYLKERRKPRRCIAEKIELATLGDIPATMWGHEVAA